MIMYHDGEGNFSPGLARAFAEGRLKPDGTRHAELYGEVQGIARRFAAEIAEGRVPRVCRATAEVKLRAVAQKALERNLRVAAEWDAKAKAVREKIVEERTAHPERQAAREASARLRIGAMSDSERAALVGEAMRGRKILTAVELDILSGHFIGQAAHAQLRQMRAAAEADPSLEVAEGQTYAEIARMFRQAGNRILFRTDDGTPQACSVEALADLRVDQGVPADSVDEAERMRRAPVA